MGYVLGQCIKFNRTYLARDINANVKGLSLNSCASLKGVSKGSIKPGVASCYVDYERRQY
jgi:hypothetical protein